MKWIFISFILAGCSPNPYHTADLQVELSNAKEKLSTQQERIIQLEEEIAKREVGKIAFEIEKMQKEDARNGSLTREERLAFFHEQREILDRIIKHNLKCSDDAQFVLNKILTYITEMSDTATE